MYSDEWEADNYEKGRVLEEEIRQPLIDKGIEVIPHIVYEGGEDLHVEFAYTSLKAEIFNWKPGSKMSPTRFRLLLENLKGAGIKVVFCSFKNIFTTEQKRQLNKIKVKVKEIGFQLLPDYLFEGKPGTRKLSKRTRKYIKQTVLSFFYRITNRESIIQSYYPSFLLSYPSHIVSTNLEGSFIFSIIKSSNLYFRLRYDWVTRKIFPTMIRFLNRILGGHHKSLHVPGSFLEPQQPDERVAQGVNR